MMRKFALNLFGICLMAPIAILALPTSISADANHTVTPKDQGDRYSGAAHSTRSAVIAQNGMAATSQPLATQVALDILKKGGSAVDAAIAANAAIGLMEPTGNGIGGDIFAIIWDPKTKKLYGLNGSGRAPMGQTLAQIKKRSSQVPVNRRDADGTIPDWGALSVTIPGTVDGWFSMHRKFGKLPMDQNLAPAIGYAENGFPVSELISYYWGRSVSSFKALHGEGIIEEVDNMQAVFAPSGSAPKEGQIFKNPDLARTLSAISKGGRDAFYNGDLSKSMDQYFRRIGAPHRASDFAAHKSEWIDPVSTNYRGFDVWELPPNGQGIAALQILNILEGYDLKNMGRNSADFWHVFTEAKKLAFVDRARFYADPAFAQIPLKQLLSKGRATDQKSRIKMDSVLDVDTKPLPVDGGPDTIYLTVADKDGMMVSLIQSNYRGMGSGLVPDDGQGNTLGFMFQDRGAQFSLDKSHPNAYAPGKRPFHTIIPAFMTKDNKPLLSFGLMGGAMQPQGHAQIVINMVDFGMNVQQAGDAARLHHTGSPGPDGSPSKANGGTIEFESGVPKSVAQELRTRGHQIKYTTGPFGGYQAIWRDPETGVYWGASEFRKDGQAAGY